MEGQRSEFLHDVLGALHFLALPGKHRAVLIQARELGSAARSVEGLVVVTDESLRSGDEENEGRARRDPVQRGEGGRGREQKRTRQREREREKSIESVGGRERRDSGVGFEAGASPGKRVMCRCRCCGWWSRVDHHAESARVAFTGFSIRLSWFAWAPLAHLSHGFEVSHLISPLFVSLAAAAAL